MSATLQYGQLRSSQSSPIPTPRKTGSVGLLMDQNSIAENIADMSDNARCDSHQDPPQETTPVMTSMSPIIHQQNVVDLGAYRMSPFHANHGRVTLFHRRRIHFKWLDGGVLYKLLTQISEQSKNLALNPTINTNTQSRGDTLTVSISDLTITPEEISDASKHELQRSISAEEEVAHLKRELASAFEKIANLDEELTQSRSLKLTVDQIVSSPIDVESRTFNHGRTLQYPQSPEPYTQNTWSNHQGSTNRLETNLTVGPSIPMSNWSRTMRPMSTQSSLVGGVSLLPSNLCNVHAPHASNHVLPGPVVPGVNDMVSRSGSAKSMDSRFSTTGWPPDSRPGSPNKLSGSQFHSTGHFTNTKLPRPVDSRSHPSINLGWEQSQVMHGPWNNQLAFATTSHNYGSVNEPMNYRRLLDRNMSCNWNFVVDKIVCNNDQQASIFLQQKLKLGTKDQKFEIVKAIITQAYPLMTNRFGNFLVQRCFEHGTPDQVVAIANAIRGNTLALSMDAFGCHVVQKAFDCVPEEFKAVMVHELLRRIPETVIHRYACHVWQKLFELRWSDSPPQIMKYVNEALRGMWHEVALGETGSLVVQNIFENCLPEDKRPCINEVLSSIDIIAHGQFGNWCIQHICEHGAPADRNRAIDHILRFATEYSTDQYASKVIEKCLKVGGNEFLDRYLDRVCQSRADRPRIPLIDISSDQFGNYLTQWILTNSSSHHREIVASHIRKHLVSLRGSKYGSRVALFCSNQANQIRPGQPTALVHRGFICHGSSRGHHGTAFR